MIVSNYGIENHQIQTDRIVHWNLSVPALVETALRREEGRLTAQGAICAMTFKRTGRSPKDKFIVRAGETESSVAWGKVNAPCTQEVFDKLHKKMLAHLAKIDLYVTDAWAGADQEYGMPVRIITTRAWHALFVRQLFRRPTPEQIRTAVPQFVVIDAPDCLADPAADGVNSETFIACDFAKRLVIIGGTHYAGEMKKSIFTALNYTLPPRGIFPMHCSANVGEKGDVALFFGLSGTGKTTLSADPQRRLIGDDEHGWSDRGVFNFEGGCYAKCIKLTEKSEPQIYKAIRFGSVLENVEIDDATRQPNYDSQKYTENTRAAYPTDYIDNAIPEGLVNSHPKAVIFLTCDAFGVLPPISKLTTQQAMYHFLSGYTAKLAGTEAGVTEPQSAFSTGFGEPFLPRNPMVYAKLLAEKLSKHNATCYLINTGWQGGPYGVGKRIDLASTRAMITAALEGKLTDVETIQDPIFGLYIPTKVPNVDPALLIPKKSWKDAAAYDAAAKDLAARFVKNFERFPDAPEDVKSAGPRGG